MKLFWTGTDSLMLVDYSMRKWRKKPYWFVFRILIKLMDIFIECHYCVSLNVADNLRKFGTKKQIKILHDKIKYNKKFDKKRHKGFNIIYYYPINMDKTFIRWLYGIDIIEYLKNRFPDINFIRLDGNKDMSKVYPITDFMVRPNRHDGHPRIVDECEIQDIPYYWSYEEPNMNALIKIIKDEVQRKS